MSHLIDIVTVEKHILKNEEKLKALTSSRRLAILAGDWQKAKDILKDQIYLLSKQETYIEQYYILLSTTTEEELSEFSEEMNKHVEAIECNFNRSWGD